MRGEILIHDPETGDGLVSGDDLHRYGFTSTDPGLSVGRRVDFLVEDDRACSLIALRDVAPPAPTFSAPEPDLGLWGYFIRCMTSRYIDGAGRARRKEYWAFALFHFLALCIAITPIIGLAIAESQAGRNMETWGVAWISLVFLLCFAFVIPGIAVTIRRFHDVGFSGWLVLLGLFPYIGGLFIFIVALVPSQQAFNAHGPPPKGLS